MDPRLTMMVMRREHDQRMNALAREFEIRQALGGVTHPESGSRAIAAGLRRALRVVDAGWISFNRGRRTDEADQQPGGEGSVVYSVEQAAA